MIIPIETIDAPDLDCTAGHHAYISEDEECFSFPVYDFFLEWQDCEDPDSCVTPFSGFVSPSCFEAEEDIPF